MKAAVIDLQPLRLITAKSKQFPEGNREAFASIEGRLETLRGRKFYGIVFSRETGLEYHAGLVPADESEVNRFQNEGFSVTEIPGGPCARVKLLDWTEKTDQIGPVFGELITEYGIDPSRPQLEFYRSQRELHLLLPIPRD